MKQLTIEKVIQNWVSGYTCDWAFNDEVIKETAQHIVNALKEGSLDKKLESMGFYRGRKGWIERDTQDCRLCFFRDINHKAIKGKVLHSDDILIEPLPKEEG